MRYDCCLTTSVLLCGETLDAGSMNSNKEVDRNHVGQTEKAGSPSAVVQQVHIHLHFSLRKK